MNINVVAIMKAKRAPDSAIVPSVLNVSPITTVTTYTVAVYPVGESTSTPHPYSAVTNPLLLVRVRLV